MRVGLVGCGRWGKLILRDLIDLGCSVSVVARSPASRERATEGGAAEIVDSIDSLVGIEGVVVATPANTHAAVIAEVLDLEVPVFVEKPLTDDPIAAERILERAPDRVFVMDKWRYHPGIEAIGEVARSGEFGRLERIVTRRLGWGHRADGVDSIWVLLPHDLAIVTQIAGFLPDAQHAVGWLGNGQDAAMVAILGPDPACVLEVSSLSPVRERSVLAQFAEAVVLLDDSYADALRILRKGARPEEEESRALSQEMPLRRELEMFVAHLRGGPPPRSSAAEGERTVRRISQLRSMAGL